ncbi:hypothetical protein BJ170DRAFT_687081 [Xylariales sp. AK1849]|nr:hypothetical protein BJ170DRAFT_687081 [Xylariales sp. AK1849]
MKILVLAALICLFSREAISTSWYTPAIWEELVWHLEAAPKSYHGLARRYESCRVSNNNGDGQPVRRYDGCKDLYPEAHISIDLKRFHYGLHDYHEMHSSCEMHELETRFMATLSSFLTVISEQGHKYHWSNDSSTQPQLVPLHQTWTTPRVPYYPLEQHASSVRRRTLHRLELACILQQYSPHVAEAPYLRKDGKPEPLSSVQMDVLMGQRRGTADLFSLIVREFTARPVVRLTLPEEMSTCLLNPDDKTCRRAPPGPMVFKPLAGPQKMYMTSISGHDIFVYFEEAAWAALPNYWPVDWNNAHMEMV